MAAGRGIMLVAVLAAVLTGCGGGGKSATGTFTDSRDGTVYKTVEIGGKRWFAENLNYDVPNDTLDECYGNKCYKSGLHDTLVVDECYGNSAKSCAKYGRMYNWFAANIACPAGWHLSDSSDWNTLMANVGGSETAGKKLKSKHGWKYNDLEKVSGNGTDKYGFSALPGGYYGTRIFAIDNPPDFHGAGRSGIWWSATNYGWGIAWNREMSSMVDFVREDGGDKNGNLFSVRCVED